ncbi:hypothetical protein, partial [Kosakonia cowanii]|uniref:hypothetical protein n=1 Tax=Kosakonia cowanii TaxID=208223 RepID=UPI0040643D9A
MLGLSLSLTIACSGLALPGAAVSGSGDGLAIGTNLYGIADWSTEVPFLDLFKSARAWIPQCAYG